MTVGRRQFLTTTALGFAATGILSSGSARHAQAQSQGKTKVTIGYGQVSMLNAPVWIAKERGFFDKYGLDAEFVQLLGTRLVQGMLANSAQFIISTAASPFVARAAGADIQLIGSFLDTPPNDIVGDASVKTFADSKGKVVAVDLRGDFSEFAVRIAMREAGADADAVTFVQGFETDGARLSAVTSGSANITLTTVELRDIYRKAGLHTLFSLIDSDIKFVTRGLFTTSAYGKKNPAEVRRFLMAMSDATLYFKNNKEGSLEVIGKYAATPPEANASYYDIYAKAVKAVPDVTEALVKASLAPSQGDPRFAPLKPDYFYDASYMDDLQKSGFFQKIGAKN